MTEKKNEQGSEPGRPSWAAGLDLSPQAVRPTDETIKAWTWGQELVLRRLALAEMRVAELERDREVLREVARACSEIHAGSRGEPDYLIDRHGDCWVRVDSGGYAMQGGGEARSATYLRAQWGPVTEAWK